MKLCWVASLALVIVLVGCTKSEKIEYGLKKSETLRINIATEPPTLDWTKATDTTSALIQENIMDGLVHFDYDDPNLGLKPALATKWKSENKAQRWVFTLRDDVVWGDGKPFTAQQVLDGWERLLNPNTASQYAYFLFSLKNAQAYNSGEIEDFSKVGVKINDDGQIVVELEAPESYFPQRLTHHSTYPIRTDLIEKHNEAWTSPENMVGLGPFNLKVWNHDEAIVLERNPQYYGVKPGIKNILAYMIQEASTAINLYDADKLDVQMMLPSSELRSLRQREGYREAPVLSLFYYGVNTEKEPMNDPKVRQAISHAINRKEITDMLGGGEQPMTSWVPPGMFGHNSDIGLGFDPKKAKALMKEAGYEDQSNFPKITLAFNTNEDHQRVAENVQAQLRTNLGIDVELANEEWKVYLGTLSSSPPHLFRFGWLADFPDPDNFLKLMTSSSDNNHTGWGNEKFDKLIKKAVSITDKDEREELYNQAQKILTEEDVPAIPIYAGRTQVLVKPRVQDFPLNSMGRYPFAQVSLQ